MTLEQEFLDQDLLARIGIVDPHSLAQLAFIATRIRQGPIVEIGPWLGRVSRTVARYSHPLVDLHLVDTWRSDSGLGLGFMLNQLDHYREFCPQVPAEEFQRLQALTDRKETTLAACREVMEPYLNRVQFHQMLSQDYVWPSSVEWAIIDGSDRAQQTSHDIESALSRGALVTVLNPHARQLSINTAVQLYQTSAVTTGSLAHLLDVNRQHRDTILDLRCRE